MAVHSERGALSLPNLGSQEEDGLGVETEPLELSQFEEDASHLMVPEEELENADDVSYVGNEDGEQFLTFSQGPNKISVNYDGSISYAGGLEESSQMLSQAQTDNVNSTNTLTVDGNTFYLQPAQADEEMPPQEDILQQDEPQSYESEYSGNTYVLSKAEGTLTLDSPSMGGSVVKRSGLKRIIALPQEVPTVKRSAFVSSAVRSAPRKVFVQNTIKGPVKNVVTQMSNLSGKTMSLAQAHRLGYVSAQNKVFIKKVSAPAGGGSVIIKTPSKILPRPSHTIVKSLPYRTIPSITQLKNVVTTSQASPNTRPITLGKSYSGLHVPSRTLPQKVYVRASSSTAMPGTGNKQQIIQIVGPRTSTLGTKIITVKPTQNSNVYQRKTLLLSSEKEPDRPLLTIRSRVRTIPEIDIALEDEVSEIAAIKSEPIQNETPLTDPLELSEHEDVDEDMEKNNEEEDMDEIRAESPQKLLEANGIRPKKPCNCTRSQCLKLYCECFANGEFCFQCNCNNCYNNIEHEEDRQLSITSCLERNPDAFRRKVTVAALSDSEEDERRQSSRGCNCKKTSCLKNYCECFEGKVRCGKTCKCTSCRNTEEDMEAWMRGESIESADESKESSEKGNPFMPKALAEALMQCILVQAEASESAADDPETTELKIVDELGQRLVQIIGNRAKRDSR